MTKHIIIYLLVSSFYGAHASENQQMAEIRSLQAQRYQEQRRQQAPEGLIKSTTELKTLF